MKKLQAIGCALALALPLLASAQSDGGVPATVSQIVFSPAAIASGGTSLLSIVLSNTNATAATVTQSLVDSLPSGLTASGAAGGSCTTKATVGGSTITYPEGGSIPSGGCTITVTVKATSTSNTYYTDTIAAGALHTTFGTSTSGASGTLTVRAAVKVPALANDSQAQAAVALQAAGLTLGSVTRAASPTVPYNLVISSMPAANSMVAAGSAVNIVISSGANGVGNTHDPLASSSIINPAQQSVAAAVDRVCANLQKPGVVLNAPQKNLLANCKAIVESYSGSNNAAGLQNALNAVSGKQTTAQQRAGIEFSGNQFQNIAARLAQLRQGASGFSFAGLDTGGIPLPADWGQLLAMLQDPSASSSVPASSGSSGSSGTPQIGGGAGDGSGGGISRWGFFVNGNIRRGTQDTTEDETGFNFKSNGVTAGIDYRFTDHIVFGIAGGHSNGNTEFVDGSGRIDSHSNTGSLYGTYYNDAFYVDAIGTFGHIDYDEYRTTTYQITSGTAGGATNCNGDTCTIETNGSTGAREFALGTSAGYSFHGAGFTFGPDVALDWTHIDVNGFTENDPYNTGMALAYDSQLGESLLLKAGGHISYALSTPIAVLMPQVRAHFIHEFKDDQRALTVHYVDDPTINSPTGPVSNFAVFTDQPDRNYADWAASITAQFPFGLAAFVDYSSLAGYSQLQTHELTFGIRFQAVVR
jgi:outer membrane lipase/esterase